VYVLPISKRFGSEVNHIYAESDAAEFHDLRKTVETSSWLQ